VLGIPAHLFVRMGADERMFYIAVARERAEIEAERRKSEATYSAQVGAVTVLTAMFGKKR
jgi:hypothetical protein